MGDNSIFSVFSNIWSSVRLKIPPSIPSFLVTKIVYIGYGQLKKWLYCVLYCFTFVCTVFCFVLCLSLLCFVLCYVCLYCVLYCFTFVSTVFCFVLRLSVLCFVLCYVCLYCVLFYVCLCCVLEKHLKVMFKWKVDVHNFPLIINWPTMYICVVKTIREEGKNFPYRLFFFLEQLIVLLLSSGIYAEMWGNGIIFARQKAF